MLELLAGPFDIIDLDGNPVGADDPLQVEDFYYDDDLGLMFSEGQLTETIWIIQLDGTAACRSMWFARFIPDIQNESIGRYLATDPPYENHLYTYSKKNGVYTETLLTIAGVTPLKDIQVRADERYLGIKSSSPDKVRWSALDMSTQDTEEATLTGNGTGRPVWSRTRDLDIMALAYANGNIIFYDHIQKQQAAGASFIGDNLGAWYSARHNIWVKLTTSYQLEVYANAPRPSSLSNPAGDQPLRGRMTTYTVQLLGAQSEPCVGELINWSLGGGDAGELKHTQSTTDANGNASIDYFAPVVGALGSVTIKAEFKF